LRHYGGDRPQARHGEPGAEEETFAALARVRQITDPLGAPMAHVALAWVAAKPGVDCVLLGSRKAEQLEQNRGALSLALPKGIIQELDEATEALDMALGSNADYFQGGVNAHVHRSQTRTRAL
jgi:aryl-alcohol dehydrogenase-like predicted oxidoreductase